MSAGTGATRASAGGSAGGDPLVADVLAQLAAGGRVRRDLPDGGFLNLDRPLPFLLLHRREAGEPAAGIDQLLAGEAAIVSASSARAHQRGLSQLIEGVAAHAERQFGAFLLIEIWESSPTEHEEDELGIESPPSFRILHEREEDPGDLVDRFEDALARVKLRRLPAKVRVAEVRRSTPGKLPDVLRKSARAGRPWTVLGLEILPVYRSRDGLVFVPLLRTLRRSLSRALRRTLHEFMLTRTSQRPEHFHVLGRRSIVKNVWDVDRRLASVSEAFGFLLMVTPANSQAAWNSFRRSKYSRQPVFHYRHLPFDPARLKRELYLTRVDRIEDPALFQVFQQKQDELGRKITLLGDRNTPRFLPGGVALYGSLDPSLLAAAERLLELLPRRSREARGAGSLNAEGFAERARAELDHYRKTWPALAARVEIRTDMASGLMVSGGNLLVGADVNIPAGRVEALLQHEVGTHVLTYTNGAAQPFRLLRSGLAGYDPLQEGLAVLAEHLVGGLSRPRLRLLAGRVIAAFALVRGADFIETFRLLTDRHGFERRTAFTMTLRIHRGGGLIKDAFYLDGLIGILKYFGGGGRLKPLLLGKMAFEHIPIVRELQWRQVLKDPPLMPRYLELPGVAARLEQVRDGITVFDLAAPSS